MGINVPPVWRDYMYLEKFQTLKKLKMMWDFSACVPCLADDPALERHVFCHKAFILEKAILQHVPGTLEMLLISETKLQHVGTCFKTNMKDVHQYDKYVYENILSE